MSMTTSQVMYYWIATKVNGYRQPLKLERLMTTKDQSALSDDIDILVGREEELATLVEHLDKTSLIYGMEILAEQTKLMNNNSNSIQQSIKVEYPKLEAVDSFKYISAIIPDDGSKQKKICPELCSQLSAFTKLKTFWQDRFIFL